MKPHYIPLMLLGIILAACSIPEHKLLKQADSIITDHPDMDGLITRLREECPFLKEDDVNFLGLIFAGFSVRAVCMFTGMEYQHFYVKKSRLMKRIQNSDAPDRELFARTSGPIFF